MRLKFHWRRLVEFFIVGFLMGIVEDLIAVEAATGVHITWEIVGIIALVALPFAIFSELIVDMIEWEEKNGLVKNKKKKGKLNVKKP